MPDWAKYVVGGAIGIAIGRGVPLFLFQMLGLGVLFTLFRPTILVLVACILIAAVALLVGVAHVAVGVVLGSLAIAVSIAWLALIAVASHWNG